MNIVLGVCTHAERRHASRIGIGRNFRLLSAATVVTVEGSLLLSANTMKYKPRFASKKKKKKRKKPIALLRKRQDFTSPPNVSLHIAIGISFSLCCSFLVSASSHTWSFSWIAQNTARLNTNREIRPYSLRTVRYC